MAHSSQFGFSPREVLRCLSRHKGKASLFAVGVMLVAVLVTFFGPETYQSESKLFVRLGRESVVLDPVATSGQHLMQISDLRENEINSVVEMLHSRTLIERVVDELGPKTILGNRWNILDAVTWMAAGGQPPAGSEGAKLAAAQLRDKAIRKLNQSVKVYAGRKSSVVTVACTADSPKLAQEVVARLVGHYREQHVVANGANGSHDFFADQTAQCRTVLDTTSAELRDVKNKIGLATLASQHELLSKRIGLLQEQLSTALSDAAAAETAVADMKSKHAEMPATLVISQEDGYPNHAADLMRAQLYALQIKEQELLSLYQDDFPQVREIQRQIKEAKTILDSQTPQKMQVRQGLNESREHLHLAALTEESKACSLRTKAETLRKHLDDALAELRQLNDQEIKVAQLERELTLADANYRKYSEHLEQARIDAALQAQQISNINVVQPATYVLKPILPNKLMNLGLGLAVAVLGALWIALAAERMDRSLKSPKDVAMNLELPVLVSIPRFKGQHQNGFTEKRAADLAARSE